MLVQTQVAFSMEGMVIFFFKVLGGNKVSLPNVLLDTRPWPEGSDEIGSVCPSCLFISFLGIGSLVFSETYHCVKLHI